MAFTNVRKVNIGGGLKLTVADWTFTQAAASETILLEGGRVWMACIMSEDTAGAKLMSPVRISESVSGSINTVTVYGQEGVTTGRASFLHGS